MVTQQFGGYPGCRREFGEGRLGIGGDLREVRRALDVQAGEPFAGSLAHEADSPSRDCLWIAAVDVARHERHAGHADDVGFPAGQRKDARSATADHDRGMRALHRTGPPGVSVHLNEVA